MFEPAVADAYTRLLFGKDAVHSSCNLIVQSVDQDRGVVGVFQTRMPGAHPLMFGSQRTHVLAMGDLVFRPHLVLASDGFRGRGLTSLAKDAFMEVETWMQGDIVLDPMGHSRGLRG